MIYAISLAYTQKGATDSRPLSISELTQIGSIAGHEFLEFLDEKLKPQSLKNCSKADLHALFLLIIGTILAVGYIEPNDNLSDLQIQVRMISSLNLPSSLSIQARSFLTKSKSSVPIYVQVRLQYFKTDMV